MEYKLGIYDLCRNNNFLKEVAGGFFVVPQNEAPAYYFSRWQPCIDKLLKHGVSLDQLFIAAR